LNSGDDVRSGAGPEATRYCDLLLTGGIVVTMDDDRRVLDPGAVVIVGDRIEAVAEPRYVSKYRARRTIDCTGKALLPSFVNCHNHLFHGLAKGLGEGEPLWEWLSGFLWPYASAMTGDDARIAATIGAIEAAHSGISCMIDNHYAPADLEGVIAVADAIEEVGLRGVVARGMFGGPTEVATRRKLGLTNFLYSIDEELEITRACMVARSPDYRVRVWPAPQNIIYIDQDLLRRTIELAKETGTRWHTHYSESPTDAQVYKEVYGIEPLEWLHYEGLLGSEATIAHGIWLSEGEIEYLGAVHAGVSHNPISNQYLSMGVVPLRRLREAGAVVGLGTDGPACNNRQDIFECMKQSILLQRVGTLDPTASNAEEALELATREGARYVGLDAGVLAQGKLADVAIVNLERPHLKPLHRLVSTLAYSASAADIDVTIVGGRIIYENKQCTLVDEKEMLEEARRRASAVLERSGLGYLTPSWRHDVATSRLSPR
jgi:5-methylthioadenosine/S-adenosylhomocysteine deaminase